MKFTKLSTIAPTQPGLPPGLLLSSQAVGSFKDVYSVMNDWGANHGVLTYVPWGDLMITLASMLRIPVNMHNVERERIFRPDAWNLFGTSELEAADYRACTTLGPLYK